MRSQTSNYEEELVCSDCGSRDVQVLAWVWANTDEYADSHSGTSEAWCERCRRHVVLLTQGEYKQTKDELSNNQG